MPKILAQAGISLADVYDVEGSIAGTDELLSEDVSLVHEMGGHMMSERCRSFVVTLATGDQIQNANFAATGGLIPDSPNRIHAAALFL